MSEHTPTPWKLSPWHVEEGPPAVRAPAGHIVCTTSSNEDAAFIVLACNNHDRLTRENEAMRLAMKCIANNPNVPKADMVSIARTALASLKTD